MRPSDNPVIICDHSLITERLGWEPEYTIFDTVKEMFEEYSRQEMQPAAGCLSCAES
jgi:GDP-4-dehydro-6-deoxy-D-mannose reductase